MRLLIYGFGFTGRVLATSLMAQGWSVAGTSRSPEGRAAIDRLGVQAVDPARVDDLGQIAAAAAAILVAAPPDVEGCPGLRGLGALIRRPDWIGYLSTTGVYGDRNGGWAFERDPATPISPEGERRFRAERDWRMHSTAHGLNVSIFRLPGIYGPGRSSLDRVRAGDARRLVKPGHVFSRIHVEDIVSGLEASITRPEAAATYNLCDDEPCPAADVTAYAARLLGVPAPAEQLYDAAALSPMARRFWAESRRVSNARAKAVLGWRPKHPSYREGLTAILAQERSFGAL